MNPGNFYVQILSIIKNEEIKNLDHNEIRDKVEEIYKRNPTKIPDEKITKP